MSVPITSDIEGYLAFWNRWLAIGAVLMLVLIVELAILIYKLRT